MKKSWNWRGVESLVFGSARIGSTIWRHLKQVSGFAERNSPKRDWANRARANRDWANVVELSNLGEVTITLVVKAHCISEPQVLVVGFAWHQRLLVDSSRQEITSSGFSQATSNRFEVD